MQSWLYFILSAFDFSYLFKYKTCQFPFLKSGYGFSKCIPLAASIFCLLNVPQQRLYLILLS